MIYDRMPSAEPPATTTSGGSSLSGIRSLRGAIRRTGGLLSSARQGFGGATQEPNPGGEIVQPNPGSFLSGDPYTVGGTPSAPTSPPPQPTSSHGWQTAPGQTPQGATTQFGVSPSLGGSYSEYLKNHEDWINGLSQTDLIRATHAGFRNPYQQNVWDSHIRQQQESTQPGTHTFSGQGPTQTHTYDPSRPINQPYTPTPEENRWRYDGPPQQPPQQQTDPYGAGDDRVYPGGPPPPGSGADSGHSYLNPPPGSGQPGSSPIWDGDGNQLGPGGPEFPDGPLTPPPPGGATPQPSSPPPGAPPPPTASAPPSAPGLPSMPNAPTMPSPTGPYGGADQNAMHQNSQYLGQDITAAPTPGQNLVDRGQFAPDERAFDGSRYGMTADQTVEGRLEGILSKDSPLMQRAQTEGMQYGNSRGLLNSSMAAGAAQGAMIDRAMPIAQQDAQQAWQRQNQSLTDQQQQDMEYIRNDIQTSQAALQQAINQGDMQLANQLETHLRQQTEILNRGTAELDSMMAMGRDTHGANLDVAKMGYEGAMDMTKLGYQTEADMLKMGYGAQVDMDKMGYQAQVDLQQLHESSGLDLRNASWLKDMDTESRSRLMEEESGWAQLMKGNDQAAETWRWAMNAITMIQEGEGTPQQKQQGTAYIMNSVEEQRDYLESLYGISAQQPDYAMPGDSGAGSGDPKMEWLDNYLTENPVIEQSWWKEPLQFRQQMPLRDYARYYASRKGWDLSDWGGPVP